MKRSLLLFLTAFSGLITLFIFLGALMQTLGMHPISGPDINWGMIIISILMTILSFSIFIAMVIKLKALENDIEDSGKTIKPGNLKIFIITAIVMIILLILAILCRLYYVHNL